MSAPPLPRPWLRRTVLAVLVVASTLAGTGVLAAVLQVQGLHPTELLLLALFPILFGWITLSFWTATAGFLVSMTGGDRGGLRYRSRPASRLPIGESSRAAILVPVYNENPDDVFVRVKAVHESLRRTGQGQRFDFFILSDTNDPEVWIAEELAWNALCENVDGFGQIFYRHRPQNTQRKSGNIADFCQRWGAHYEYMVVFDADSVMAGDTLVEMVSMMDAHPHVALIQSPPVPVGQDTAFARLQQFASSIYGAVYATGLAFWALGDSSYWGHNAIIRTAAFIHHCGLPTLPGREPLGGEILSHDFIEAALLRRAGWEVWLVPDLGSSYEETPPTLVDHAKRDRRWCQGNLQHARLVFARGLHPLSRLHLAMGVMSYACSPLWLLFIIVAGIDAYRQTHTTTDYFLADSIFPAWPPSYAVEAATLLAIMLTLLYLPKLFGLILVARDRQAVTAHGGLPRAVLGIFLESLFSVLLAPILMLFQSRFVLSALAGQTVAWNPQKRTGDGTDFRTALAAHGWQTVAALAAGWVAWHYAPTFFWWLTPVLAGPLLAIPISMISSRPDLGIWLRDHGLFLIPAETKPSAVLQDLAQARAAGLTRPQASAGGTLVQLAVTDPFVNALHVSLQAPVSRRRSERSYLASLVERVGEGGWAALSGTELREVLCDADSMLALHHIRAEGRRAGRSAIRASGK